MNAHVERPSLPPEVLKPLYARSNVRPALHVLFTLGACVALVLAFARYPSWLLGVVAFFLIGGLQHRLSILQHEANHRLLFTSRTANEWGGRLCAWPVFFTMGYRETHLAHHQKLGADDDPDLQNYRDYPLTLGAFLRDLLYHLSGLAAVIQFLSGGAGTKGGGADTGPRPLSARLALPSLLLAHGSLAGLLLWAGYLHVYVLLWILPLLTLTKSLTHFRNVAEHTQVRDLGDPELSRYRTILCNPVEGFFFAPMSFNFHAEHHLYPGIPYHNLAKAHVALREQPAYKSAVAVDRGYLRFLLGQAIAPARTREDPRGDPSDS